jgi:hypothetical protein
MIRPDRKVLLDQLGLAGKGSRWEAVFEQLEQFKQKHGHMNIPVNSDNASNVGLAAWVKAQQKEQRAGLLKSGRLKRLIDIGLFAIDQVQNKTTGEQDEVCETKDKDSAELKEYRVIASEEQHQEEHQVVESAAPKKQCLSSPQEALPPALTFPLNVTVSSTGGIEYSVTFDPESPFPLGLELQPILMANGCRVVSIQYGSQAWESGKIQLGDVVSKLNGRPLGDFCYEAISYLLHRQLQQEVTFFRPHHTKN